MEESLPTATNLGLTTRDSPHTTVTGPLLLPWSVKVVGRRWMVMTCVISPCGTDDGLWSGLATSHQVTSGTASLVWSNLHRNTIWDRLDSNIKISSVLSSQILSLFSFFSFEPQPIGDIKINNNIFPIVLHPREAPSGGSCEPRTGSTCSSPCPPPAGPDRDTRRSP